MPIPRSRLRLTPEELDAFLTRQRTVRLGTVSPHGEPHVVPLWFVWWDGAMYINSLRRSRRMHDLERGSRVAACVDAGEDYHELHGAVLYGRFEPVEDEAVLDEVRRIFGSKYWGGIEVPEMKSHVWLVLRPDEIVSWDFAKIPAGADPRLKADGAAGQ